MSTCKYGTMDDKTKITAGLNNKIIEYDAQSFKIHLVSQNQFLACIRISQHNSIVAHYFWKEYK